MKTIWKFEAHVGDQVDIRMPKGAQVLTVRAVDIGLAFWALVPLESQSERVTEVRHFTVRGTGHPIDDKLAELPFLGTVFIDHLGLVFHVWDGGEEDVR